ncbi:MAG TPA: hypothetical protein VNZ45_13850 [Bacteroidia bacterium]|nr:hypothetical protein [Bacteroidia bacterium]
MTKEEKIKGIRRKLQPDRDSLVRAKVMFEGSDLSKLYGASGYTKKQILDDYQRIYDIEVSLLAFFEDLVDFYDSGAC